MQHFSFSENEHRLICRQAASQEMLARKVVDQLKQEEAPDAHAELETLMVQLNNQQGSEQMESDVWEQATESLNKKEKEVVEINLKRFEEKSETTMENRENIFALRAALETGQDEDMGSNGSKEDKEKTEKANKEEKTEEEKEGFWQPEYTKGLMFSGIAALVTASFLLLRKGKQKVKQGAEKVKEKGGKLYRFLKGAAIIGVVSVGAFIGVQVAQNAMEKLKKAKEIAAKISELKDELASITDPEKRKQIEKEIEELYRQKGEEYLEKHRSKKEKIDDVKDATKQKVAVTKEIIKEYALSGIGMGIATFHLSPDWELPVAQKGNQIQDFINNNENEFMPMKRIFTEDKPFKIPDHDRVNREQASQVLVEFCRESVDSAVVYLQQEEGISEQAAERKLITMELQDYLKITAMAHHSALQVMSAITQAKGNVAETIKNMDMDQITRGDKLLKSEIDRFVNENELEDVSLLELIKVMGHDKVGTVRESRLDSKEQKTPEEQVLAKIYEQLRKDDDNTHKYMLPLFHGTFPDTDFSENSEENLQKVRGYLLDRMSPTQAIRFFLYARLLKRGNHVGMLMMQVEILKFIDTADLGLIQEKKWEVIDSIAKKVTTSSATELSEEWKKLDVEIDPETIEKGSEMIVYVFNTALSVGGLTFLGTLGEGVSMAVGFTKKNPKLAGLLVAGAIEYKALRHMGGGGALDMNRAVMTWADKYEGTFMKRHIRNTLAKLPGNIIVSADDIVATSGAHDKLYWGLKNAGLSKQRAHELIAALRRCENGHGAQKPWITLSKMVANDPILKDSTVDDVAKMFAASSKDGTRMRKCMAFTRHPVLGRIPFIKYLARGRDAATLAPITGSKKVYGVLKRRVTGETTLLKLIKKGETAKELLKTYPAARLADAGVGLQDLVDAGAKVDDLIAADSVTVAKLFAAKAPMQDLYKIASVDELRQLGATAKQLDKAGASIQEMVEAGVRYSDLIDSAQLGLTNDEIAKCGASIDDLLEIRMPANFIQAEGGFTDAAMDAAKARVQSIDDALSAGRGSSLDDIIRIASGQPSPGSVKALATGNLKSSGVLRNMMDESPVFATAISRLVSEASSPDDAARALIEAADQIDNLDDIGRFTGKVKTLAKALRAARLLNKAGNVTKAGKVLQLMRLLKSIP